MPALISFISSSTVGEGRVRWDVGEARREWRLIIAHAELHQILEDRLLTHLCVFGLEMCYSVISWTHLYLWVRDFGCELADEFVHLNADSYRWIRQGPGQRSKHVMEHPLKTFSCFQSVLTRLCGIASFKFHSKLEVRWCFCLWASLWNSDCLDFIQDLKWNTAK